MVILPKGQQSNCSTMTIEKLEAEIYIKCTLNLNFSIFFVFLRRFLLSQEDERRKHFSF